MQTARQNNIFEKHKRKTISIIILLFSLMLIGVAELMLEKLMGLGNPVIYDASPLYGFRPLADKEYRRFFGAKLDFNNLALRAEQDWDRKTEDKILFLGDSVTYGGSRIGNTELFSYLAVKNFGEKYISGNGGVNAWGVENVHGLVMDSGFLPAKTYVTTLIEGDFYRGMVRMNGLPFFNHKPRSAFAELWLYFIYKQNSTRYASWQEYADKETIRAAVERSVQKLKKMDDYFKQNGFTHLLFISPTRLQTMKAAAKDPLVERLLEKYDISATYLIDEIRELDLSDDELGELYSDNVHLQKPGHKLWGELIGAELRKALQQGG